MRADSLPVKPSRKPKNTGVGSLSLPQGIFLTQELSQGLLHCRRILYQLSFQGSRVCVCVCVCVMGLFIYLAALGLSRGMQIFHCSPFSSCGTQADSVVALLGLSCSAACGILVPRPRIRPTFPALQGRFLTTETPRESRGVCIMLLLCHHQVLCYRKRLET